MQPYLEQAALGTLLSPDATASCPYFPLAYVDQVLVRSGMSYDERWRNWGLGFICITFNIATVFAFYYLIRLRVCASGLKRLSKQDDKKLYGMPALSYCDVAM
ncbi:hypothetical protein IWW34DRAFT_756967 [Fusarium oxysporum f. sp. albedinis]|nr:hypothetical protein IWW34DRAFT_756967 [Fusarium oxysporum f. sp. albedinis]